ncbi:MAG: Hpt domain-containing protein [Pseudomonadota bacterium]
MTHEDTPLVNWATFSDTRSGLGADFVRILGYFREDGTKSVAQIEEAMRARNAAGLVIPAHTLKGDSAQFGAERLSLLSENIEMAARRLVELRQEPDELLQQVVVLRQLFEQTLASLEKETNPLVQRRTFGRRTEEPVDNSFGRI